MSPKLQFQLVRLVIEELVLASVRATSMPLHSLVKLKSAVGLSTTIKGRLYVAIQFSAVCIVSVKVYVPAVV